MIKLHLNIEKWKYNPNYEIFVSSLGNFKYKDKTDVPIKIDQCGYITVPLKTVGGIRTHYAHRLVMETFFPRDDMAVMTVDHINHNKRDNSVKNLEWVTSKENNDRATSDYYVYTRNDMINKITELTRLNANVVRWKKENEARGQTIFEQQREIEELKRQLSILKSGSANMGYSGGKVRCYGGVYKSIAGVYASVNEAASRLCDINSQPQNRDLYVDKIIEAIGNNKTYHGMLWRVER